MKTWVRVLVLSAAARAVGTATVDVENNGLKAQATVVVASLPMQLVMSQSDNLRWPAQLNVAGYDIVRGSLNGLRVSGDFATATELCLGDNVQATTISDAETPAPGAGFWYLLRVVYSTSGFAGSYDLEATNGNRDSGISLSPNACP